MLERLTGRARTLGGNLGIGQRIFMGAGAAGALVLVGGIANRDRIINTAMRSDMLVRSNAPNYKKVGWELTDIDPNGVNKWMEFGADPKGTRLPIPRLYRTVGVLAMNGEELDELQQQHPGAVPAVGWKLGNRVVMGEFPNEDAFGAAPDHVGEDGMRAVAMRLSGGDLSATAGVWNPATQLFEAPESLSIIAGSVPIHEMHLDHKYPGVPIV